MAEHFDAALALVLDAGKAQGLRHYDGKLYAPIPIPEGQLTRCNALGTPLTAAELQELAAAAGGLHTHAWNCVGAIDDFVRQAITKETHFAEWTAITLPGAVECIVKHIGEGNERFIPLLRPDRHWFAFQNGLFHAPTAEFYSYDHSVISDDIVACRYFDITFRGKDAEGALEHGTCEENYKAWFDIPTPAYDSLFRSPHEGTASKMRGVQEWALAKIGPLLMNAKAPAPAWHAPMFTHVTPAELPRLRTAVHPLQSFINSGDAVVVCMIGEMPWERFKELANLWFDRNGLGNFQWKEAKYKHVLEDYDIKKGRLSSPCERLGQRYEAGTWWLFGVAEATVHLEHCAAPTADTV